MKTCPYCRQQIPFEAFFCPYCQKQLRFSLPAWFGRERVRFLLGLVVIGWIAFVWLDLADPTVRLATQEYPVTRVVPVTRLVDLGAEASHGRLAPVDQMVQRYVPAGTFMAGNNGNQLPANQSLPMEMVYLDAFWIDATEVTNGQYLQCFIAGQCEQPPDCRPELLPFGDPAGLTLPVVCVTWYDAEAYCEWAGRRLPTEMEWEKAARGVDGRSFPWGEEEGNCQTSNYQFVCFQGVAPVGSLQGDRSPYGAMDMGGNVREWIGNVELPPGGDFANAEAVIRGGSWSGFTHDLYTMYRELGRLDETSPEIGFRCAEDGA